MFKKKLTIFFLLVCISNICCAAHKGFYANIALGESIGPSQIVADANDFHGNGVPLQEQESEEGEDGARLTILSSEGDSSDNGTGGVISGNNLLALGLYNKGNIAGNIGVGYNFTPNLGFEVNSTYWGQQSLASYAGMAVSSDIGLSGRLKDDYSFGVSGIGYLPVAPLNADLFAKIGFAMVNVKMAINDEYQNIFLNAGHFSVSKWGTAGTFGVGALYPFTNQLAIKLEYDRLTRFDNNVIGNISFDLFTLGMNYNFCI